MALTVLNVAYPLAPVGPEAVGGAEQILTHLDAALTQAGHQSLVIACEGSHAEGRLITIPAGTGVVTDEARRLAHSHCRCAIRQALSCWRPDLVHLHGLDFLEYLPPAGVPVLATLHLPPPWYPPQVFSLARPQTFLNCVSLSQRQLCPAGSGPLPVIENGVPLPRSAPAVSKRSFAISLGRICPEKGFHLALDAASRAGVPLVLAGKVFGYPAHQQYFQREILPRLGATHRFIGPVAGQRKRRLLCAARCLIVPSQVPETSSLVAMEALACGTPVVASPAGALAEIVEHGKTGFLAHRLEELAEAIRAAGHLPPDLCRRAARRRFAVERMTGEYLDLYHRIAPPTVRLCLPWPATLAAAPPPAFRPS